MKILKTIITSLILFGLSGCSFFSSPDIPNEPNDLPQHSEDLQNSENADTEQSINALSAIITPTEEVHNIRVLNTLSSFECQDAGIYPYGTFSPNGEWVYGFNTESNVLTIWSVNDLSMSNSISLQTLLPNSRLEGWSPDSTGILFSSGGVESYGSPISVVNIVNGELQPLVMYDNQVGFNYIAWSPTGVNLYAFSYLFSENRILTYKFDRQMNLIETYNINIPLQHHSPEVYIINNGILIVENLLIDFETITLPDGQENSLWTTQIYFYSFESGTTSLVQTIHSSRTYYFGGVSPDSRYVMIISNSRPNKAIDRVEYSSIILDLTRNNIVDQFQLNISHFCIESEDHSLIGCEGIRNNPESSLMIWNWEDWFFETWAGDYYLLGWNRTNNGFAVIDRSQGDIFTIEVLIPQ